MTRQADSKAKTLRISIIPKPGWETNLRAFKEVCARDGLSMSEELYKFVELFLRRHNYPPGNPQQLLFAPKPEQKKDYKFDRGKIYCVNREEWVWRSICVNEKCCNLSIKIIEDLEEQNRKNLL